MSYGKPKPANARKSVLRYIAIFAKRYGYPPTMREIANGLGYGSKEAIRYHLRALRTQGIVDWQEGAGRTIRIREVA